MSHLENFIAEYYDWKGYLVKRNVKVGRLSHGGWEMELDAVAYDPHSGHLVHLEPSVDAHSWEIREERFRKKFGAASKLIFKEVFTWLDPKTPIEHIAVLISHPKGRDFLAGAKIISIDEFMAKVRAEIVACGVAAKNAIPEQFPMLRTLQISHSGYYKALSLPLT